MRSVWQGWEPCLRAWGCVVFRRSGTLPDHQEVEVKLRLFFVGEPFCLSDGSEALGTANSCSKTDVIIRIRFRLDDNIQPEH
jgi:hypothetical protein